ncbi:hypothetical protein [Methylobacterium sp. WL120]|uniref:hypothetical protein n=1 Tax=Methylobacterium sp. WL120 TaxID=2603887 RepID=UPI0011CC188F|nr:hypothetical protein [Methylobacterium sp. WL120]TXM69627.1 hypothetical protein FV229_04600 [Methylobacterium sp. WL120]
MRLTELEAGAGALAEYYDWFKDARTGDVLVYWTGDLQFDRDPTNFPEMDAEQRDSIGVIEGIATRVMKDAREGYLILNQRKLGESRYEYRATRRRLPKERSLDTKRTRHALAVPA